MDNQKAKLLPIIVRNDDCRLYGAFLEGNGVHVEVDDELGLLEPKFQNMTSTKQEMEMLSNRDGDSHFKNKTAQNQRKIIARPDNYDSWGNEISNSDLSSDQSSESSTEVYSFHSAAGPSSQPAAKRSLFTAQSSNNIRIWKFSFSSVFSFLLMVVEFVGGHYSSSLAIYIDASLIFCDMIGFVVCVITLIFYTMGKRTSELNLAFYKAEILSSLSCVLLVWFTTGFFIYSAIIRVISDDYVINYDVMVIISIIGIIVNGLIIITMVGCGCCGKGTTPEVRTGFISYSRNLTIRTALAYAAKDLIRPLGIFVVAILIKKNPNKKKADPILTIIFSIIALLCTYPRLRDMVHVLLRGNLRNSLYSHIMEDLMNIPAATDVHELQIWPTGFNNFGLAANLSIDASFSHEEVLTLAKSSLRDKHNIIQSTIQIEQQKPKMDNGAK